MNYEETIAYIHATPKFNRILGNALLSKLLQKLDNPQKKLNFIHIAGTNGKGSTAAMLSSILSSAGYKTGMFTSPYIEKFNERIKINNIDISDHELSNIATYVRNHIEKYDCHVSEFALDTAIAFMYFEKCGCDAVILETGLGGRLDATNVIDKSLVSIITSISLDHTQYLGSTIKEIAEEKAGIIKPNGNVVLYSDNNPIVFDIVKNMCAEKNACLYITDAPDYTKNFLAYRNTAIKPSLCGKYQLCNAAAAIKAVEVLNKQGFNINTNYIKYGIENTYWPARFEFINDSLIIDGAHNPDAIKKLCISLAEQNRNIYPVIAMMEDKAVDECVKIISKYFSSITVTQIDMPRCINSSALADKFAKANIRVTNITNPLEAVKKSLLKGTTCVMGSLYLAGEIRRNKDLFKNVKPHLHKS